MGLTGGGTLTCAVVAVVLVTAATLWGWNRWRPGWRWCGRVASLLVGDLAAVVVVALVVNSTFALYSSWSDLLGTHATLRTARAPAGSQDAALAARLRAAAASGHGLVVPLDVPGTVSRVATGPAMVYLPAQYGDPAYADAQFPVTELLDGVPGSPTTWLDALHVATVLDTEIAAHRMPPTIAVMPVQNVELPHDAECADVVGGPHVDTYLTTDVRAAVTSAFRASRAGTGWTVTGYSTGGYCAAILVAQHPSLFAAAVSMEGYAAAAHDPSTGDLFGHDRQLALDADLLWWMQARPTVRVPILVLATRQDRYAYRQSEQIAATATRDRWPVQEVVLPAGGHTMATFGVEVPIALDWLGHHVGTALAPLPTVDGRSPVAVAAGIGVPGPVAAPTRPRRRRGRARSRSGRSRPRSRG